MVAGNKVCPSPGFILVCFAAVLESYKTTTDLPIATHNASKRRPPGRITGLVVGSGTHALLHDDAVAKSMRLPCVRNGLAPYSEHHLCRILSLRAPQHVYARTRAFKSSRNNESCQQTRIWPGNGVAVRGLLRLQHWNRLGLRPRCHVSVDGRLPKSLAAFNTVHLRSYSMEGSDHSKPRRRKQRRFTSEENMTIARLWHQGYHLKTIGEMVDRSTKSISVHLSRRLGHLKNLESFLNAAEQADPQPKGSIFKKEEDDKMLRLKKAGMSSAGVAKVLGRSRVSVRIRLSASLRNRTTLATYEQLKAQKPAKDGRKRRTAISMQDSATVVYLRLHHSMAWSEIAQMFPDRSLDTLRSMYYGFWRGRWKDVVTSDPRKWDEETLTQHRSSKPDKETLKPNRKDERIKARRKT